MADFDGSIPYESTCDPSKQNLSCSISSYCACATTSTKEAICTEQMSCNFATPCGVNDRCEIENSTCVIDSRCPGQRLCYSVEIFSPEVCPPFSTEGDEISEQ